VQWWLGRPDASLALARRGLEIALAVPSSLSQAMARHAVAMAHHLRGERAAAADAARENASLSESLGFPFWTHTAHAILGTERAISGDPGGLDELRAALDGLGEIGNVAAAPLGMIFLAEASLGVDRPGEAVEAADLGLALADATGQPFGDADLLCLKARALCALGQHDAALAASRQSLDAAQRLGAASSHLRAALTLASVIGDRGGEEVVGHLRAALARMGDGASTLDQVAARRTLATLGADSSAT
jgi:ATP/maltotriose-dependent transcriptional regulator MalT